MAKVISAKIVLPTGKATANSKSEFVPGPLADTFNYEEQLQGAIQRRCSSHPEVEYLLLSPKSYFLDIAGC